MRLAAQVATRMVPESAFATPVQCSRLAADRAYFSPDWMDRGVGVEQCRAGSATLCHMRGCCYIVEYAAFFQFSLRM